MLISIVIPLYNSAEYIINTLEKLFTLNLQNCEVVIIDDGSTDDSPIICERLIKGKNAKLIRQSNNGPGSARNTGIKNSVGKYILFLDSDDFLIQDGLNRIINHIKTAEPDVITGKFILLNSHGKIIRTPDYSFAKTIDTDEARKAIAELPDSIWNVWRYIYRREFLVKNKIFFKERIMLGEDLDFSLRVLQKAENISFMNIPHYVYYQRKANSLTSSFSFKSIYDLNKVLTENIAIYDDNLIIQQRLLRDSFYGLCNYCRLNQAERVKFRDEFSKIFIYYPLSSSTAVRIFTKTSKFIMLWSILLLMIKTIRRKIRGI